MPVVINQRCHECHQLLPRDDNFKNTVISRSSSGAVRRRFSHYCNACLKEKPELMADMYAPETPQRSSAPGVIGDYGSTPPDGKQPV